MTNMVSRDQGGRASSTTRIAGMFTTWRTMLTRALTACARLGARAYYRLREWLVAAAPKRGDAYSLTDSGNTRLLLALSVVAIVIGTTLNVMVSSSEAGTRTLATALVAAAWVIARLPAMKIAATQTSGGDHGVLAAWATGALLHVGALTPELRLLAWAAGLALSWRSMRSQGRSARDAWLISGVGYGLEAVGFVLLVVLRSLRVAVLLVGGGA